MSLTNNQRNTLKAAILADPALSPLASGATTDYNGLVTACNATKSPAVSAWRTSVPSEDSDEATPWDQFDTLSTGKRDSWNIAFMRFPRNFSRVKVRKWVTDVWGNATAGSNAETILLGCGVENATYAQAAIGGTSRTTGTVTALVRSFDGNVTLDDVVAMFNV